MAWCYNIARERVVEVGGGVEWRLLAVVSCVCPVVSSSSFVTTCMWQQRIRYSIPPSNATSKPNMSTEEKEPAAAKEEEEEEEEDLEKLQAEIARMEAEAARIAQETEDLDKSTSAGAAASTSAAAEGKKSEADTASKDGHSIYVGQVDYSTTPEELLSHFESCGTVERVTIVCDKFTGKPKGFAYLEFQWLRDEGRDRLVSNNPSVTDAAVENAIKLDGSTFKERQLKVTPKRVNDPNFYVQQGGGYQGRGGGRGFRGRGRGRGRGGGRGGYGRGGGRGFRGRGRGYNPY
eukprot:scaffold10417_cov137-Skeletonema_marinoi.AAC.35